MKYLIILLALSSCSSAETYCKRDCNTMYKRCIESPITQDCRYELRKCNRRCKMYYERDMIK